MKGFTYKGYTYTPWLDIEEDNIKIWHEFKSESGTPITCDWSPYSYMTEEDIKLWIDVDGPGRIGHCPLDRNDLIKIYNNLTKIRNDEIDAIKSKFTD